jgi:hypothetical protein
MKKNKGADHIFQYFALILCTIVITIKVDSLSYNQIQVIGIVGIKLNFGE